MTTGRARMFAVAVALGAAVAATAAGSAAVAGDNSRGGGNSLFERLSGYEENALVLSTAGSGEFRAFVNARTQEISWRLSYRDLEGGTVLAAHIHLGGRSQNGGVIVFMCGGGPTATPACPAAPATISGTFKPADVIGPAAQGITAGEFAEFVAAIRAGKTYANVHTTTYPGGEIRAQLDHH